MQLLLDAKASTTSRTQDARETALDIARRKGHAACVALLDPDAPAPPEPAPEARRPPKPKKPAAPPKPPPPPKHVRSNIGEKLVAAAKENRLKQLKELLGARTIVVDYKDVLGWSALLRACFGGHTMAVQMLLEAKANPSATDVLGRTPLLASCLADSPECAELLLAAGA